MAEVSPIIFGDDRTHRDSIFQKLDDIYEQTSQIKASIQQNNLKLNQSIDRRFTQIWIAVFFVFAIEIMIIVQTVWQALRR